jgi:hypothetical protein
MRILDRVPFEIDPEAVFARLHLDPHGHYAGEVHALIDSASRVARPRAAYMAAVVQDREADAVVMAEAPANTDACPPAAPVRFTSRPLRVNLDEVERLFPYVATCGRELDSIPISAGDIFAQFCRDTIKEMALWAALAHLYDHLTETYGLHALATMNPGSGDVSVWPIEQQKLLFAFLGNVEESIGVALTDSCLMVPNKSVSGILYPSQDGFQSCQLCRQERCPERRAPFDPDRWARSFGEAP